jgi:hypothetical protein
MKPNRPISTMQATSPNSSPMTAKVKSLWASGSTCLAEPPPGTGTEQLAVVERLAGGVDLEGVALVGTEEAVDARGDMRQGLVGRHNADEPHTGQAEDEIHGMPKTSSISIQTMEMSAAWPKSGCTASSATNTANAAQAASVPGMSGRRRPSASSQAASTTKAGLANSDG